MNRSISFVFLLFSLIACQNNDQSKTVSSDVLSDVAGEKKNRSSGFLPEPDIVQRLIHKKARIDSAISYEELDAEIWVREYDAESLTRVENGAWPDRIETTFNLWKNADGVILMSGEFPFSESGDWAVSFLQYYDEQGNTFAFERYTGFFNSECTENAARETIIEYYDRDFNRVDRFYTLTDENGSTLPYEDCTFPYDFPFSVSKNRSDYLKKIGNK